MCYIRWLCSFMVYAVFAALHMTNQFTYVRVPGLFAQRSAACLICCHVMSFLRVWCFRGDCFCVRVALLSATLDCYLLYDLVACHVLHGLLWSWLEWESSWWLGSNHSAVELLIENDSLKLYESVLKDIKYEGVCTRCAKCMCDMNTAVGGTLGHTSNVMLFPDMSFGLLLPCDIDTQSNTWLCCLDLIFDVVLYFNFFLFLFFVQSTIMFDSRLCILCV